MASKSIVRIVRRYLKALEAEGLHARRAILYGSFARNEAHKWSDIDLVVIAPEFDARRKNAQIETMWGATLQADNRIEPIPCGEREWEEDDTRPILEVARREGIEIAA